MPLPKVGTAGWSYPHWQGLVYPKVHGTGFHPLEQIAKLMDVVEINSSFYAPLKPEVVKLWIKKTSANPKFTFTAKLHQDFTHKRVLEPEAVEKFKEGLRPLMAARKLGALLMQFPWSFRLTEENREFVIRLRRTFHEYPLVAEMRHSSWMAEEAIGTLIDYRIGFCNIDQPEYTRAMPPTAFLTSHIGYVRLHGRNPQNSLGGFRQNSERGRQHDYLYRPEELQEWLKRIEHVNRFAESTFVIFNNDAAGKSVVNGLELKACLSGSYPVAPKELRRKYPMELEAFSGKGQQQWLFPAALAS